MEAVVSLSKEGNLSQNLEELVAQSISLEEIITSLLEARHEMKFVRINVDDKELLCMDVKKDKISTILPPPISYEGSVFFPIPLLKKYASWTPVCEKLYPFADQEGFTVDHEWFDQRDKKLKVKSDSWEGIPLAPATSLLPLILSYVMSSAGMAQVKRELVHIQPGVRDAAQLQLTFMGENLTGPGFKEVVYVRLDRLQKLVQGRKEKKQAQPFAITS